jgi:hypothetical protein
MNKSIVTILIGAQALTLTACGSSGSSSGDGGSPVSFQACIASLMPNCAVTASKIDSACASLTMIPIPLTDGGMYGPVTLDAGPYGGKLDWNQGAGTPYVNMVNSAEPVCLPVGVDTFQEPASVSAQVLNLRGLDHSLYTVFRPACMKDGETYPVLTWANGTCGETQGYAPLLSTVASHGYVIIASNSTWTGTPPTDKVQLRALDYAKYLNEDSKSVLYHRLNMDKIGAFGHSQGAAATVTASADPRIKASMFFSDGTSTHQPFLHFSADRDVMANSPDAMATATNGAGQPGAWLYYHEVLETGGTSTGHLVLMEQPERVLDQTIAWWDYQLKDDPAAKAMFVGDSCAFCNKATEYEYGHNDLLK